MAFTLQDDTGSIADANAYISAAFYTTYHTDRNVVRVVTATDSDADIQSAIIIATDYIDTRFEYVGQRKNSPDTQITEWPRISAFDKDNRIINGIALAVKQACAEYALFNLVNGTLYISTTNDSTGQTIKRTRTKVDVIEEELEYHDAGGVKLPKYFVADNRLKAAGLVRRGLTTVRV